MCIRDLFTPKKKSESSQKCWKNAKDDKPEVKRCKKQE